jgi:hypothetical protein
MLLADLGAEVIKLESATGDRCAGWSGRSSVASGEAQHRFLDLKSPDAASLEALFAGQGHPHHNLRMPAAHRLGSTTNRESDQPRDVLPQAPTVPGATRRLARPDQLFQSSCGWEAGAASNPPMWHRLGFMGSSCRRSLLGCIPRPDRNWAVRRGSSSGRRDDEQRDYHP